jgi:hypothetical protein
MRQVLPLLFIALACLACPTTEVEDIDGDGYPADEDCDDLNASANPAAGELCDGVDNDCDGVIDEGYDEDADGHKSCGDPEDCDDTDPTVHPGAEEVCDGVDNNCDQVVDEGCTTDVDGDGYVVPIDCDDSDPLINPDAEEVCDGVDNNCDGTADEGFDADGDGWSWCDGIDCDDDDPAVHPEATELCDGADQDCDNLIDEDFDGDSDGWTTCHDPADCDDSDPAVHPLAPELCNGADDDCDGLVDEDTTDDNDGDGVSACNGDCDDSNPDVYPGAVEVPNGIDDDCSGAADDGYDGTIAVDLFGPQATGAVQLGRLGDVLSTDGYHDSDDLSDFVAGSGSHDNARGRAYVFLGESFAAGSPPASFSPFATITGLEEGDYLGHSVDLGDINDDGYDDVIVGAPESNQADPPRGRVYIWFGGPVMSSGNWPPSSADVEITGAFPTEQCGTAVAALGDVDGDGIGDLGFTCPWFNPGDGNLRGRTAIFFGQATWAGSYTTDDADATIVGEASDSFSGQSLAGDFDFNGDGFADLAIGSPNWDSGTGRVAMKFGMWTNNWSVGMSMGSVNRLYTANESLVQELGSWIGSGDANGDTYDDLLLSASALGADRGRIAVVTGGIPPLVSGYLWTRALMTVKGDDVTEEAGASGALVDLDGDGASELVVPTPGYDGSAGGDQGRVTVFNGPLSSYSGDYLSSEGDVQILGEASGDYLGGAMTRLTDFNGDGAEDLIVAAPYHDTGAGNGGRIYFIPGF